MGCCHSSADGRNNTVEDSHVNHLQSQRTKSGNALLSANTSNRYNGSDDGVHLAFDAQDCKEVEKSFKQDEAKRLAVEQQRRREEEEARERRLAESHSRMDDQEAQWKAHDEEMAREQVQIRAQSERTAAAQADHDDANVLTL